MSAVAKKQPTSDDGDHYIAMGREPVQEDTPADTSSRSIRTRAAGLAGIACSIAGVALTQSANATVVTAGGAFIGVGAVIVVAACIFNKYCRPKE